MNYAVKISATDKKYMGDEPKLSSPILSDSDAKLCHYFSWHSYFFDASIWKSWVVEFMVSERYSDKQISDFKAAPLYTVTNNMGVIAKLIALGIQLPSGFIVRLKAGIDAAIREAKERETHKVPKIKSVFNPVIADIEDKLDELYKSNYKLQFSLYEYLTHKAINRLDAQKIMEYYTPVLADVVAYPKDFTGTKAQYKAYTAFLTMLVEDAGRYAGNKAEAAKKPRKPRKAKAKKAKPAADLVKGLKHKKENVALKLVSVNPETIIGASGLILYNDKYRSVTLLVAKQNETLSVKGTTVVNIDEKSSFSKTIRKPDEIPDLIQGNSKAIQRKLDELKTKANEATGRINSDTLLLKVFK
jgi:hypothetical protein